MNLENSTMLQTKLANIFSTIRYKKETNTCGIFQLYFYENLTALSFESSIINNEKLTKNTIQKQINKIFALHKNASKEKMKMCRLQKQYKIQCIHKNKHGSCKACSNINKLICLNC